MTQDSDYTRPLLQWVLAGDSELIDILWMDFIKEIQDSMAHDELQESKVISESFTKYMTCEEYEEYVKLMYTA